MTDDDSTSLGTILLTMGVVTSEQLRAAIAVQESTEPDMQLGNQLVVMQACNREQLDEAIVTQRRLRSGLPHEKALAGVDITLARRRETGVVRRRALACTARIIRKTEQPSIAGGLLTEER